MYIDFKISIWERITIPEHLEKEFVEKVKNGDITSSNQAFEEYGPELEGSFELLLDTGEPMSLLDSGGAPTIQLFNDINDIIYDNGRKG